jgi:acyl homoserine lactone synthase
MDVVEPIAVALKPDAPQSDLVYSRAGVALPRQAQPRPRAGERHPGRAMTAPLASAWYSVRSCSAQSRGAPILLEEAYRLRAHVFMRELGWLAPSADGRERDRCDRSARHFAIYVHTMDGAPARLAGYARALLPRDGFMLQREFIELLGDEPFAPDPDRGFEVTRFAVHPTYRSHRDADGRTIAERLARGILHWALACGRDECYTVCETRYLRAQRWRGLRFMPFGQPVEYQPGVEARAAMLRLPEAAADLRAHRPRDYAWYMRGGER